MATGSEMIDGFQRVTAVDYGARFYRTDLHFHTPASEDARGENKYNCNPYAIKFPAASTPNYTQEVKRIQEAIAATCRGVAKDMVEVFIKQKFSLVAVTDHNSIGTIWNDPGTKKEIMDLAAPTWYELIDDEAQKVNTQEGKTRLAILPGVEISTSDIHILAIFPPQEPRRKVHFIIGDLLNELGFEVEDWGKNPKVGKTGVYHAIQWIIDKGGLPILAHTDAHEKAFFRLYKMGSTAMRDVLTHQDLNAIEIVDPTTFEKPNSTLIKSLSRWISEIRKEENLPPLAYFQGSDAHGLQEIGKRSSYVKMTGPSFAGLKIAMQIPTSRIRLYDDLQELQDQEKNSGLYIYGMEIHHPFFEPRFVRFNRHLNCVTGKLDSGKSTLFELMQQAITPPAQTGPTPGDTGNVTLFMEKIKESQFEYYGLGQENGNRYLYSINKEENTAKKLEWSELEGSVPVPHFYDPVEASRWISTGESMSDFLSQRYGLPIPGNIDRFNETFAVPFFLEEEKQPLLYAEAENGKWKLSLDVQWNKGKKKYREFSTLDNSLKRVVLTCIFIISGAAGPLVIDAPEEYFNNEDIVNFLIPIIQKYKDIRQIVLFTNHPLLAINTDPENYILLDRGGEKTRVETGFSIDQEGQKQRLIRLMEGSLQAFRQRKTRYEIIPLNNQV